MGRGNLKQVGIYLFWLANKCSVNLLGIPVGTLRGLDSDGRCFLSSAPQLIGIASIKQMVALLIFAPARTMSPLARTGAPDNDTVNDYRAG